MTLNELREHALFQTANDLEDLTEFQPALEAYVNEGYDKLVYAYARAHLDEADESGEIKYKTLVGGTDAPATPAWTHRAIADYATYMLYRNGNPAKQARGAYFYQMFDAVLRETRMGAGGSEPRRMKNLYA